MIFGASISSIGAVTYRQVSSIRSTAGGVGMPTGLDCPECSKPLRIKVGTVTWQQCRDIAEQKMEDLNAFDLDQAASMIAGTARSMGLEVSGRPEAV